MTRFKMTKNRLAEKVKLSFISFNSVSEKLKVKYFFSEIISIKCASLYNMGTLAVLITDSF